MPKPSKLERQPFLRWLGGKRLMAHTIVEHFPDACGTYYEPFLGSGAVFFRYAAECATLSDTNDELVNAYRAVRDRVEELIDWLSQQPQSERHYYGMRRACPRDEIERAGRFIYLNRTAFNGVWRVNRRGEFNVPYGHRVVTDLVRADRLRSASLALSQVKLQVGDFADAIDQSAAGDVVYADPPYTVRHNNNGFVRFNEKLFSWQDQVRLAGRVRAAVERGVFVVVSNAAHDDVRELYSNFGEVPLTRLSRLAAAPARRGRVTEALFVLRSL